MGSELTPMSEHPPVIHVKFSIFVVVLAISGWIPGLWALHFVKTRLETAGELGLVENNAYQSVNVSPVSIPDKILDTAATKGRDYLTVSEYAGIVGCHYDTALGRINRGELSAQRHGKAWRIPIAKIMPVSGNQSK